MDSSHQQRTHRAAGRASHTRATQQEQPLGAESHHRDEANLLGGLAVGGHAGEGDVGLGGNAGAQRLPGSGAKTIEGRTARSDRGDGHEVECRAGCEDGNPAGRHGARNIRGDCDSHPGPAVERGAAEKEGRNEGNGTRSSHKGRRRARPRFRQNEPGDDHGRRGVAGGGQRGGKEEPSALASAGSSRRWGVGVHGWQPSRMVRQTRSGASRRARRPSAIAAHAA